MISETLTAIPGSFAAGETVSYLRSAPSGYAPADGWTLTLYLAGENTASAQATEESGAYRVTLTASETSQLEPGSYRWVERLSDGAGVVHDLASGTVIVLPNIGAAASGDLQTWAEKTLPIVEAAIAGRLPSGMESYQIAGRAVSKIPIRELVALRGQLQAEVNRIRNRGKIGRTHKVYFPPTG